MSFSVATNTIDQDTLSSPHHIEANRQTLQNNQWHNKIIGGSPAPANEYPWYALVLGGAGGFCGGSLVAPDIVLSAAHCEPLFSSASNNIVIIGGIGGEEIEIESAHPHLEYKDGDVTHDFMILKLKNPVYNVTPVKMDQGSYSPTYAEGKSLWVAGYGDTDPVPGEDNVSIPGQLLEAEVDYVSQSSCTQAYSYYGIIDDSMMCASSPGKDSCQGDSGGPLYDKENDVLTGVVSFGIGCANSYYPGVYGRIAEEWTWIQKTICEKSKDKTLSFCHNSIKKPSCSDVSKWHLSISKEYDCNHFASDSDYCEIFGNFFTSNLGLTANEACCVCGGGLKTNKSEKPNKVKNNENIKKLTPTSSGEKKTYSSSMMIGLGFAVMINAYL